MMTDYFECKQQMEDLQKFAEIDTAHKLAVDMQQEAAKYAKLASLVLWKECLLQMTT